MKLKKKTAMLASFALGTLLLATTALADITAKSGYEQLKDALKVTAENCSSKFDSFTLDISYVVKDNEKTYMSQSQIEKHDRRTDATENITDSDGEFGAKYHNYFYSDKTAFIRQSSGDETYYVTEFTDGNPADQRGFSNPFKENGAEDIEKIVDAVIGNLKDHVVVKENADGSKELSGALTEVQIPPLVNAVSSFLVKQELSPNRQRSLQVSQDIFIKTVQGKAVVNKDGVLESVLGTAIISGKDEQGQIHEITIEILAKLTGINSTTVAKPDLTGKKVVKEKAMKQNGPEISNPEKFIGKFKNDIVIEKEGKFVKVGERIIDIAHIDKQTVAGKYHVELKPGFEAYAADADEFNFEARFDKDPRTAEFDYTLKSGLKQHGQIHFDDLMGKVYLGGSYKNTGGAGFDSVFSPAFE